MELRLISSNSRLAADRETLEIGMEALFSDNACSVHESYISYVNLYISIV